MILYQNELVKLSFNYSIPCLIWKAKQDVSSEIFRNSFKKGMDFIEEKILDIPEIKWLNDCQNLKKIRLSDLFWFNSNLNKRISKLEVKRLAFVLPQNIYSRTLLQIFIFIVRIGKSMKINSFLEIQQATNWLMDDD